MKDEQILEIIEHGQKLAALVAPGQEALVKVAQLEKTAAELRTENIRLRDARDARQETLKLAAERSADFFVECGVLKSAARQETVDELTENPEAVFELARKFADHVAGTSLGAGAKTASADTDGDAIVRFARS